MLPLLKVLGYEPRISPLKGNRSELPLKYSWSIVTESSVTFSAKRPFKVLTQMALIVVWGYLVVNSQLVTVVFTADLSY